MKEIKFRAYHKKRKEIFEIASIDFEEKKAALSNGIIKLLNVDFKQFELLQYTGLTDKNGTGIYEGDIVLIEPGGISTWYKTVIEFKEGALIASLINGEDHFYIFNPGFDSNDFEVIGNIYENKKILEDNKWVNTR